uniref:hypothetical protein n=1 Tax=Shewanella algae TaxID=38313 RepID=UPI0031F4943E
IALGNDMNVMLKGDFSSTLWKADISQVASIGLGPVLPTCAGMICPDSFGHHAKRVKSFNEVNNDIKDQTTNLYI